MPTQLNQVPEALQSDFDIVGDSGFFVDPQQLFLDSLVKDPRDIVYPPQRRPLADHFPRTGSGNPQQRRIVWLFSDWHPRQHGAAPATDPAGERCVMNIGVTAAYCSPFLNPSAVARLQTGAEALAAEVLDEVLPIGEFDFFVEGSETHINGAVCSPAGIGA